MLGAGVSLFQTAVRRRLALPIIGGTGPVLAALAGGNNLNVRVTWGSYTPTAPAVSINALTVKEYRVNGGAWTTFGSFVVSEGQTIEVRETVTDNTGRQRTFGASRVVPILAPVNTVAPSVIGNPREGDPITRSLGTWTGLGPIFFEAQWLLNGADIPGETGNIYTPVAGDVGGRLSVRVSATNGGGTTVATSAQSTPVLAIGSSLIIALGVDGDFLQIYRRELTVDGDFLEIV